MLLVVRAGHWSLRPRALIVGIKFLVVGYSKAIFRGSRVASGCPRQSSWWGGVHFHEVLYFNCYKIYV